MVRGSSQAPPSPGIKPTRTKLSAKLAAVEAMRRSHMQARSQPAPMAAPVLGGLLVADEVIDIFLPVLFYHVEKRRWLKLKRTAAPAAAIQGAAS